MFTLFEQANAAEKATTVLRLETRLAKAAFQFLASAPLPAFQGDAKFTYWVR